MTPSDQSRGADVLVELAGREPHGCPDCGLYSCVCFEDDDMGAPDEDDGWDECGMMPDGFCSLAGTEWCDWDCPRNRPARAHGDTRS